VLTIKFVSSREEFLVCLFIYPIFLIRAIRGLFAFLCALCVAIHQILLVSRKIYLRSRGRLRSIKIFGLVAAQLSAEFTP